MPFPIIWRQISLWCSCSYYPKHPIDDLLLLSTVLTCFLFWPGRIFFYGILFHICHIMLLITEFIHRFISLIFFYYFTIFFSLFTTFFLIFYIFLKYLSTLSEILDTFIVSVFVRCIFMLFLCYFNSIFSLSLVF